jgi:hypothetical protein
MENIFKVWAFLLSSFEADFPKNHEIKPGTTPGNRYANATISVLILTLLAKFNIAESMVLGPINCKSVPVPGNNNKIA